MKGRTVTPMALIIALPMSEALMLALRPRVHTASVPACFMRAQAEAMTELEACVVNALSEDDVQVCMQMADAAQVEESAEPLSELDLCIINASNEDDVTECMRMLDD